MRVKPTFCPKCGGQNSLESTYTFQSGTLDKCNRCGLIFEILDELEVIEIKNVLRPIFLRLGLDILTVRV